MRQWRVGTLSMGILLIGVGIALLLEKVNGIGTAALIFRWWPVVLILLGCEILGYAYFSNQESPKIKYDGLSIFIVIIIIMFSCSSYMATNFHITNGRNNFFDVFSGAYKYESNFSKKITIDPKEKTKLDIINSYGNIDLQKSNTNNIEVLADIKIMNNDEKYSKLISDRIVRITQGEVIKIESTASDYVNDKTKIKNIEVNFTIKIPKNINVNTENEYGDISARDMGGALTIKDRNGRVSVASVAGDLKVENQYGDIEASEIKGKCEAVDKNGQVSLIDIGSNVKVENEYGRVGLEAIRGTVYIKDKNAEIEGSSIDGNVEVDSEYCNINLEKLKNNLSLIGRNGEVAIADVVGGVKVQNEYGNIKLTNANKGIEVTNKNGNIEINNDNLITDNVKVNNEFGNIDIAFANNQNGQIKASLEYGEINDDFNLKVKEQGNEKSIDQKLGNGGIEINLKTRNGNINIQ
jgi:hypothetical protein